MPIIPTSLGPDPLATRAQKYLKRIHQGKVRDTYEIPGHPDKLLVVATDRLSIFDFVLGKNAQGKGENLTATTIFWLIDVFADIPNHLIAYGSKIDAYLPEALRSFPSLQKRAIIVKRLNMLPIECIVRGYLTGSGLAAYKETGMVCGHMLPEGLHDGSKLTTPLFTPTTKPTEGHDEHVTAESVLTEYGEMPCRTALMIYERAAEFALERDIIIADMKIEMSLDGVLADEVLTPDSCRFWDSDAYTAAVQRRTSPTGFDKEVVRQAGKQAVIGGRYVDLSKLDLTSANAEFVGRWMIPVDVLRQTMERYHTIFQRLTGISLKEFQQNIMDIHET